MSGSLEEAYVAVERAYGEGDFSAALARAETLQPQVQAGRPDLLDQRLQLLIGHIHLYGLNRPIDAAAAYGAVLASASEPAYRELASQGLALSQQQQQAAASATAATTEEDSPKAESKPTVVTATQTEEAWPATPWLSQLQDPQRALRDIQAAWATVVPAAPVQAQQGGEPSTPWQGEAEHVGEGQERRGGQPAEAEQTETQQAETAEAEPASATTAASEPRHLAAAPEPSAAAAALDPDAIVAVVVSVESAEESPAATGPLAEHETETAPAATATDAQPAVFSEAEWADLCSGLLLVDLTSSNAEAAPTR